MIGRQLAELRHASGLTQEQLAERARVSVDVIRRLEQGQRKTARITTLHAIAAALGTTVSLGFADRMAQESTPHDRNDEDNEDRRSRDPESSDMKRRELLRLITAATAVISSSSAMADQPEDPDLDRLTAAASGRLGRAALADLAASTPDFGARSSSRRRSRRWLQQSGIRYIG
jgi:transcriptional regulator with XRE-family HTH domain